MHIQAVIRDAIEILDAYQSKRVPLSAMVADLDVALRALEQEVHSIRNEWGSLETINALDLEAQETQHPRTDLEQDVLASIERLRGLLDESTNSSGSL